MVETDEQTSNTLLETLEQWETYLKAENIDFQALAKTSPDTQSEPQPKPKIQTQQPPFNPGGPTL